MSKQGTNGIGTVILTACLTAIVMLAGGWFMATRYLGAGRQEASAPHEAPAPTPSPRRKKAPSAPRDANAGARPNGEPSTTPAESDAARIREDAEPSGRGIAAPAANADAARGREESDAASAAPIPVAPRPATGNPDDPRTIMEEVQRRTEAKSYQYQGLLQAFDAKDRVTEKRWTFARVGSHGHSKAVLRFTAPAEVKGVALLIFNHPERASDQWMWTPAIERDRRIALQDRSTRFFGTDFSFEDLEERDVDQYDYSMLGNDTMADVDCWKIQSTPKPGRSSQYSRSIIWIRKDNYALTRMDNFVNDEVVRRATYSSIENIQGIWTPRQTEMAELHRGSRTRLTLQAVNYNLPAREEDFTLQAIRRQ